MSGSAFLQRTEIKVTFAINFYNTMANRPSLLPGILGMKCPNCRKGNMYINKSIFPLKEMMHMPERCPVCGQKMELEVGFYYGTGYVSYALSVGVAIFNAAWFGFFVGFSWKNNSIWWYLGITVAMLLLLQPLLMRYSRVLYLYMFVKYGSSPHRPPGQEEQTSVE
ncbi:DUF983 domain-containing protein [Taibaiella helva]|uniref:DUF983 domain-containing protein n=1 Tax=Taibaiella helva TaxID=2301235 RepID=UPI001E5DE58A|nr:DUF983 domain-containing protein [Taibaiella helva]